MGHLLKFQNDIFFILANCADSNEISMLLLVALSVSTVNVVNVFFFGFPHKKYSKSDWL